MVKFVRYKTRNVNHVITDNKFESEIGNNNDTTVWFGKKALRALIRLEELKVKKNRINGEKI